jgi:hypothetical protein
MTWLYGDDPSWYRSDDSWSAFDKAPINEEEILTMTVTLSPRAAAQKAVDNLKKLTMNHFEGGRWGYNEELDVVVLDPPRHNFTFAFHRPTLKFFRSNTRNGTRMTSTSLRTVIDPERSWLVVAMKRVVPDGGDFLAFERGDQSVLDRRARAIAQLKSSSDELEVVQPEPLPVPQPEPVIESPAKETPFMALLDVQSKTRKIVMEEITRTLEVDRKQLVAVLRQAGAATMKRNSKIVLILGDGKKVELGEGAKLQFEWTDNKEHTVEG